MSEMSSEDIHAIIGQIRELGGILRGDEVIPVDNPGQVIDGYKKTLAARIGQEERARERAGERARQRAGERDR